MDKILYCSNRTNCDYNFVMAYPEKEQFALSSLGYMWLYKIADELDGINAVRVSTDKCEFPSFRTDSVAFSISFDFDFMGVFEILEKNKIPFLSEERGEIFPIIFAGGPVITTNPRPYDKIFDFMIIGDGEEVFIDILNVLKEKNDKSLTLNKLSEIGGVYVPSKSKTVNKRIAKLDNVIYTPILSEKSYFKDTFIIELQRGCMNRCAFCTASYLNLPFRTYAYENIIKAIDLGLGYTNKIALLGAQISAHPDFEKIISYLLKIMEGGTNLELGISSLRADSVTPELVQTLVKGGQKTSTIAIEAASERLRKFINKNLSEEQIFNTVKICKENGLRGLKIYSMIGLPTETQEDIDEFIALAKKLKSEFKGFEITFSFSTFVPKPHTPLERMPRESTKSLEKKQKYLEKGFAKLGVESRFSSAKWDYWQTLLSRGDANLGNLLISVYKNGGGHSAYKSAINELKIDVDKFVNGYDENEMLPWDIINTEISDSQLKTELSRLIRVSTKDT